MATIPNATLDLQKAYAKKRYLAAEAILQACKNDDDDKDITQAAIYALINFKITNFITELLNILVHSQKTDLLYNAMEYMEKKHISSTMMIEYIRPLSDSGRKEIITLFGIQKRGKQIDPSDKESEVNSRVNTILEWFHHNDADRKIRSLAGKYLRLSNANNSLLFGIPCVSYLIILLTSILISIGSYTTATAGLNSDIFIKLGNISTIFLCIGSVTYYPIALLLNWSRPKPIIHNSLIIILLILIILLFVIPLRAS